jgi:S-layer homology domain
MKRISAALALTAALAFGVSAYAQTTNPTGQIDPPQGQTQPQKPAELKDVPAGHWAQEAIKIAADCGLLRGFPDGTYRGQQPFTRYQAAVVIARLLEVIKTGQCGIGTGGLSADQLTAIQNAVQELSADLAQLGVRVAELEDNAVTQDDLARVEELATQARDLAEAGGGGGVSPDDLARVEEIANQARDLAEAAAAVTGADPEALKNLTDQVEAASIAADTALAQSRELQDKVDELSGRVDDLEGQLGELGATVEGQADSIAALNDLVVLLNQDVLSLQDRVATLEAAQADLQDQIGGVANQEDLEALREFTTLLRRDQTALQDRVADLEARTTKNEADIKALDDRVTVLEANAFTISGTLSLKYVVSRTWRGDGGGAAPDFDIDRLGLAVFSSGTGDVGGTNARDYADFGNARYPVNNSGVAAGGTQGTYVPGSAPGVVPVVAPSTTTAVAAFPTGNREGAIDANIGLSFTLKPRNLLTDPGSFPAGSITLGLSLDNGDDYATNGQSDLGKLAGIKLNLTGLSAKFSVGAAPAVVNFGIKPGFAFSTYAFNNTGGRGDGFVAEIGGGAFPLGAQLTVAYGSKSGEQYDAAQPLFAGGAFTLTPSVTSLKVTPGAAARRSIFRLDFTTTVRGKITVTFSSGESVDKTFDSGTSDWEFRAPLNTGTAGSQAAARGSITSITFSPTKNRGVTGANTDNQYFSGVRGQLSLIPGFAGGVYYAVEGPDANAAVAGTGVVFGLYGTGKLFGLIDLEGEHSISKPAASLAQNASYIKAGIGIGIFSVAANYRFIENGYAPIGDDGQFPFKRNQSGFGVDLGITGLFNFLTITGYYDSRSKLGGTYLPAGPKQDTVSNPAAATGATNFGVAATISLIGFDITGSFDSISEQGTGLSESIIGVSAKHDGSKPTALIGGLNLAIGYSSDSYLDSATANETDTSLYAYADFAIGSAGSFQLIPKAYYASFNYGPTAAGTLAGGVTNFGVGLTANIPFLFGSTLNLGGAYDSSSWSAGAVSTAGLPGGAFTAGTTWLKAGLSFPNLLIPNSTFSVSIATRTDTNRDGNGFGPSFAAPDGTGLSGVGSGWGRDASGRGGSLTGLYLGWSYYGLQFGYGIFNLVPFSGDTAGISHWGQEFSIGYSLKF